MGIRKSGRNNLTLSSLLFSAAVSLIPLLFAFNSFGCTIGCAAGEIPDPNNPNNMMNFTEDGRPLIWKTNNGDLKKEKRAYYVDRSVSGYTYNYIVVTCPIKTANEPKGYVVGLNEEGLSIVYSENKSLRKPVRIPNKLRPKPDNNNGFYGLQKSIIGTCRSVAEAKLFLEQNASTFKKASGNYSVIDAHGEVFAFELTHKTYRIYDPLSDVRASQSISRFTKDTSLTHSLQGFFVRGNALHWQHESKDKSKSGNGRYLASAYNVLGMVYDNQGGMSKLSPIQLLQGDGITSNNGYEVLRYGAGKETSKDDQRPLRTISCDSANAGMIVHGVKNGEEPEFATLWVLLGHPNYGISIPMWASVSDVPEVLNREVDNMYQCSEGLAKIAKKIYRKKKKYRGFEKVIQETIFPLERQIYETVTYDLLPQWRSEGFSESIRNEMTRFEQLSARDAYNALNWFHVNCSKKQPVPSVINDIPDIYVTFDYISNQKRRFTATITDQNADYQNITWNFGDGTPEVTSQTEIVHRFQNYGSYLVSCTIIDSDNLSNTGWVRVEI